MVVKGNAARGGAAKATAQTARGRGRKLGNSQMSLGPHSRSGDWRLRPAGGESPGRGAQVKGAVNPAGHEKGSVRDGQMTEEQKLQKVEQSAEAHPMWKESFAGSGFFGGMGAGMGAGKIELRGGGIGVSTLETVGRRARELAEIAQRSVPTVADWQEARREVLGLLAAGTGRAGDVCEGRMEGGDLALSESPSEISGGLTPVIWGVAGQDFGHRVWTGARPDEPPLGERLVEEGMAEAEHEFRLDAAREEQEKSDAEELS
jgi:hypothetical protein